MTYTISFVDEYGFIYSHQTTDRNNAIAAILLLTRQYDEVVIAVSSDRGQQILSELGGRSTWYPW